MRPEQNGRTPCRTCLLLVLRHTKHPRRRRRFQQCPARVVDTTILVDNLLKCGWQAWESRFPPRLRFSFFVLSLEQTTSGMMPRNRHTHTHAHTHTRARARTCPRTVTPAWQVCLAELEELGRHVSRLSEIHMKHGTSHKRETKGCVHLSAQQSGSLPRRCQALLTVGTRHRRWGQPTKPRRSSEPAELIVGSHVKKATSKGDAILYASSTTRSLESAAFFSWRQTQNYRAPGLRRGGGLKGLTRACAFLGWKK